MKHLFHIHEKAELLKKQLTEEASEKEELQAEKLLTEHPRLNEEIKKLRNEKELERAFQMYSRYSSKEAYQHFLQRTNTSISSSRKTFRWWYAAVAAAVIITGFFIINIKEPKIDNTLTILAPGESKGILELNNGQQIIVEKQKVNLVEDGIQVNYKQGKLSYATDKQQSTTTPQETDPNTQEPNYNKFIIPRGGENTVVLSDGSIVRLNSDSKLTYPVYFTGKQRIVMLEGEAFFDVAKDPEHPFIVRTHYGEVHVLGTAFNVNAYNDNEACYTTLVRGKVCISSLMNEYQELMPGEQAIMWTDRIEKHEVNVEDYVGWINGIFSFHSETLYNIMSKLERWYNIEVVYEDPELKQLTYTGTIKRYENINSFLNAFELTGDLTYRVQGRCIYLSSGKK